MFLPAGDSSSGHTTDPVLSKSTTNTSPPLKRKFDQQQLCTDSTKKQKLQTPPSEAEKQTTTDLDTLSNHSLDARSERDVTHPLSQPSCSSHTRRGVDEKDNQSLSQSSDARYRKNNIPWRINLPESFYTNRRELRKKNSVHSSLTPKCSPSSLPRTYKSSWDIANIQTKNTCTSEEDVSVRKSPIHADTATALPSLANSAPSTSRETEAFQPLSSSLAMQGGSNSTTTEEATADQSVPRSPRGGGNFAIVFSEGEEEEEEEGGARDGLISSQMNRQIKKVTTFLKMDRLRRTKAPKV